MKAMNKYLPFWDDEMIKTAMLHQSMFGCILVDYKNEPVNNIDECRQWLNFVGGVKCE